MSEEANIFLWPFFGTANVNSRKKIIFVHLGAQRLKHNTLKLLKFLTQTTFWRRQIGTAYKCKPQSKKKHRAAEPSAWYRTSPFTNEHKLTVYKEETKIGYAERERERARERRI